MEVHRIELDEGAETAVTVWPHALAGAPAVLFLPAMGMAAKYYAPLGAALHAAGFQVVIGDFRNHGAGSLKPSRSVDFGYTTLVRGDCAAMVAFARKRFAQSALFIGGHSLGGHVTALYAALAPAGELTGLFGVAAGSTYYRGWHGFAGLRVLGQTQLAAALSLALGYFPGQRLGFAGLEPKTQMTDWARLARTGRFQLRGDAYDYEAGLAALALPTLALSIADDEYAPQAAARQLYGKLERASVQLEELPADAFGRVRVGHFAWVKTPGPVVERISTWVDSTTP